MTWMDGDADWVHPSRRTPEGKAAWEEALAEVKHFSEIAEEEVRREEAEYKAKIREGASEAEWDRRLAQRVTEGPLRLRHYGVWHPKRRWAIRASGELFVTTHKAVAEAQRDAFTFALQGLTSIDSSLYEVRCIEEWYETMEGPA